MSAKGVTLVEVLFALIILATAVLSAILLLPVGVKAVEQSRYQMYASMKATELLDLLSQSRKNWSNNDLELNDGTRIGASLRLETNGFAARNMPDLEQVILTQSGSAFPVPMEIARRLDAPGNAIGNLVADGGLLFYPDPFPNRDGLRQAARFGNLSSPIPEMQKLVFGIVTPAQQNLLPNNPVVSWPYYEMYPFPPQTSMWLPTWTYRARRVAPYTISSVTYRLDWDGPYKSSGATNDRYEGANWTYMASNTGASSPWALGATAFSNLARYGYAPLWFKISYESGSVSYDVSAVTGTPPTGEPVVTDSNDSDLPPKPGGPPGHWRGTRVQDTTQNPNYFASVPAGVEAARVAMNAVYPATPYVFDDEINMRLPSLGMRRFYRQLALELWNSMDTSGKNPLIDDLTTVANSELHPAKILALSHLADAAMNVTGYRLPYINNKNSIGVSDDVNLEAAGALTDDTATYKGPGSNRVLNQFAGNLAEANPDGTLKTGVAPTAAEDAMAARVHENLMYWIMRYSALFPYDMNVPRPANRQMMTDRPLLAWDLFDGAGAARRTPANYVIPAILNDYDNVSKNNAAESFYQVLMPDGMGPGTEPGRGPFTGVERLYGTWSNNDDAAGDLGLMSSWRSGYTGLRSNTTGRWWYDKPFDVSHRTRMLVFWAVDWKSYEDAESTPSTPLDVGTWQNAPTGDTAAPEDHPEAAIVWTNANRNARNDGDSNSGQFVVHNKSYWYGQFGADRNGNGIFDQGRVPATARMRATEVARFVYYDPVTYRALRR